MSGLPATQPLPYPNVQARALWNWNTSTNPPTVVSYPSGQVTKSGLLPNDLQNFVGVPLQFYGNPPTPVPPATIIQWIQWAEQSIEAETSILLTQTWVAAPPEITIAASSAAGVDNTNGGGQQLGFDYDMEDAPYDFFFPRAQDEGWMVQQLRYKPLKSLTYDNTDYTAIKNYAYIYPLLSEYFKVPPTWYVEDHDAAFIRLVPAANVQMLPLFAMQLAFMGFAESIPGGIHLQYTAGLTPLDYKSKYSFVSELILAKAAIRALSSIQGTINLGMLENRMSVDGMDYTTKFDPRGPYNGLIREFKEQEKDLMRRLRDIVGGPILITLH